MNESRQQSESKPGRPLSVQATVIGGVLVGAPVRLQIAGPVLPFGGIGCIELAVCWCGAAPSTAPGR